MKNRVMIVEDNDLNLKLFRDLLEAHKFEVIETRDGKIAFPMAEKEQPDLIIMDIQLPQISGYEIIRQMKEAKSTSGIPIIAVTAFATQEDQDKIMASGCEAYLAKPISIEPFVETVKKFM